MPQHTIRITWEGGLTPVNITDTQVDNAEYIVDLDVPVSTTNAEVGLTFDKDRIASLLITCDKALTIRTNNSSTPDTTIVFAAGQFLLFTKQMVAAANPFSAADVTRIFVTNPSTTEVARLRIRLLWDITP